MKKSWKKLAAIAASLVMASTMAFGFAACDEKDPDPKPGPGSDEKPTQYVPKQGTYRTYTSTLPSNWNELTYQDNSDTAIMNYIGSSFYSYDYKFDEDKGGKFKADGSINKEAINYSSYTVKYSAATALEDVTDSVDAKWGYTQEQKTAGGYAYKITLRQDLKWDDGTPIEAADFVYTMKEQLDPDYKHYRANSYYDQVSLINARDYLYKKDLVTYQSVSSQGYANIAAAVAANADLHIDAWGTWGMEGAKKVTTFDVDAGTYTVDENAPTMPQWVSYKDEQDYYLDPAIKDYLDENGKFDKNNEDEATLADFILSGKTLYESVMAAYGPLLDVGGQYSSFVSIKVVNTHTDVDFEDVGIYAASKYELVVCLNKPLQLLNDDGSLNWQSAYYMSSLPLVHHDKYEASKKAPETGSTLWTTNYNSSLETTASWGPYKLTSFQGGKSYTLERNEYWYGYNIEDNKNQYNVTKIECEKIDKTETAWMQFLSGKLDSVGIDRDHSDDYRNSKYASYEPSIATFGVLLSGDLKSLNDSERNNSILAVASFRKAFALALNREDFCATVSVANQPCYGLLGSPYYSDIDKSEVYRDTVQAKKALLRAYGYTENADGTWSNGTNVTNLSLQDAYETLGGNNITLAKQELAKAIAEVKANPNTYNCDLTKEIKFTVSVSVDNAITQRQVKYIQKVFDDFTVGTELEGKIKVELDNNGAKWATDFQDGKVDIIPAAGFGNAPYNVGYMIGAHIDPDSSFFQTWDTETETITFKMVAGDFEGAGKEYTMTAMNLYRCLNGNAKSSDQYKFNWGAGAIPESARLEVMAVIEEWILTHYYFIPAMDGFSAILNSAKFSDFGEEYNTFIGYGGMKYVEVNYTDAEWEQYVSDHGNDLTTEYKKTED